MPVIDFTKLPKRNKMYAGANGSKLSVIYEGEQYMLRGEKRLLSPVVILRSQALPCRTLLP